MTICIKCVKEPHLKQLIEMKGSITLCSICGETKNKSISIDNSDLSSLIKAVVRFNYSEWDYNEHLGGDSYESLFYGNENIFFHQDRSISEENYEALVSSVTNDDVYEDYDKGVSIYAGYDDNLQQKRPLTSLKTYSDPRVSELSNRLKIENYFELEQDVKALLSEYVTIAEKKYNIGCTFYRARIGVKERKLTYGLDTDNGYHFNPFSEMDISAPPPYMASSGRVNRHGVSFFYCATDLHTAISEVRPHPGDYVSTGKFVLKKNANVFNLSDSLLIHFYQSDEKLDQYTPFITFSEHMNRTVPPSERQHYSVTQLISDCIRKLNFDGIVFKSTVGNGDNIVLFDSKMLEYTSEDQSVVKIQTVKYDYTLSPLIESDRFYL